MIGGVPRGVHPEVPEESDVLNVAPGIGESVSGLAQLKESE